MKFTNQLRTFLFGSLFGAWIGWLLLNLMIRREFSGLEMAKNDNYMNLKVELIDVLGMFPLVVLIPVTIFLIFIFLLISFLGKKKQSENTEIKI